MATTRPYPRRTLEQALRVPQAIKDMNGGNAWSSEQLAKALDRGGEKVDIIDGDAEDGLGHGRSLAGAV